MDNKILFFLAGFVRNPKEVGALFPSSTFVAKKIAKSIDFNKAKVIVELGSGTGTLTKEIIANAQKDTKIYCFETDKKFCIKLKNDFEDRVKILNQDAINVSKIKSDCIVSGLPFFNFSPSLRKLLLAAIKRSLNPDGSLIMFGYTTNMYKMLNQEFQYVDKQFVPLNLPPCFIFHCKL